MNRLVFAVIILLLAHCQTPQKQAGETTATRSPSIVEWMDENTLHITARGKIPQPRRDISSGKLLACQQARERAIAIFHETFLPGIRNHGYEGRKFSNEFHRFHIEINTVQKSNDESGDCDMVVQFRGENLKQKLTVK